MGRFNNIRPDDILPDPPKDGSSGKGWVNWVDELLDNIFNGIPTFEDLYDFLEDNSWEDYVPADEVGDLISTIYDKIDDNINPKDFIPDAVLDEIDDMNIAGGLAELAAFGYDKIVDGEYINPWTGNPFDYTDFNIVVPKVNKTTVKGSNKDDLMSGHWESHKYLGKGGNDAIFTWYGNDTLDGGKGNDRLYVDGDRCTMIGGKGKDNFYLDNDGYALIKDYSKGDTIYAGGMKKGKIKVKTQKGDSIIKNGKKENAKVINTKLNKKDLKFGGHSSRMIDPSDNPDSQDLTAILLGE